MSGKGSLRARLARIERAVAGHVRQQELATCICGRVVVGTPLSTEEFKAELERTCSSHGFRHVLVLTVRRAESKTEEESVRAEWRRRDAVLDQLKEEYEARESAWKRAQSERR